MPNLLQNITCRNWRLALVLAFSLILSPIYNAFAQTLVWEEHFDSTGLNPNRWTYDFGDGSERAAGFGWGNSELQYYTSRTENVRTEGGSLLIEARKENFANSAFTSGRIKTEGRVHFKYGTVEARIKLPTMANGLWPAFWTLGTIGPSWPGIGEIDIMEAGSQSAIAAGLTKTRISSAAHWSNAANAHQFNVSYGNSPTDLTADYHLYKMVWTSQHIKMYVDNVEYYSFDISSDPTLSEFHTPHYLLVNLAVGGSYTNIFETNGITAPLPGKMLVDYIKLYQNPGDELHLGANLAAAPNFGVLTETTPVTDSLNFASNATLYFWNNLTNITTPAPTAFEGSKLWAVRANAGDWFGMGIDNNYVNINNFAGGSLKFHFKSTYNGQYKFGLKSGHGESWINFAAGTQKYGLVRDGNWHEVTIPIADFSNSLEGRNIDLFSIKSSFMFAGDPAATNADFFFDNIYFFGTPVVLSAAPTSAAPTPPARATADVISLFSGAYTDLAGTDWFPSWGQSTVVSDTTIVGNPTKKYENFNYQGVQFLNPVDASGMTKLHIDIWTPNTIAFEVYPIVPGQPEVAKTLNPTVAGWNSFDIDLATIGTAPLSNIIQLKFVGAPAGSRVYLDNIYFYKAPPVVLSNSPITPAPTPPARETADVISLFSGAYTDLAGTEWFPNWGQTTVVTDTTIVGNPTKKYENFNYQGVQFLNPIDASGMTKLHIDIWTPNTIAFEVYPIVPGQPEVAKTLNPTVAGWNSFDIDLATIGTAPLSNIIQLKFVGAPAGSRVYLDNIYFYKAPVVLSNSPLTAAPTPPARNTGDVISFFSGAYTDLAGTEWFPNWGQSTVVSDTTIVGDLTKKYENLNYQGVQFLNPVNASGMTHLHLDIWTPNTIAFEVYPIVPGQPEVAKTLTPTVKGWNSYDIELATIGTTPLSNIIQFKFVGTPGGARVYLDNIYFWKSTTVVVGVAPTISLSAPANNAQFIAPATVTINATAADTDGTVTKVEFFESENLLGTDLTSPYSFDWNNVAPGNYTIKAKVTDNDNNVVVSAPVSILVKPVPCTGTAVSGDYSYEVYTQAGKVYFTFKPLAPIAGSNSCILYLKEGGGGYAGYGMTASGSDFTFNRTIANGVNTSFYFTYNTPPAGERNSSADPHSYFTGTACVTGAPTVAITSPTEAANFTAPASITINATATDGDGTVTKVEFYNGATLLGEDLTSPYSYTWENVAAGNYTITAKAIDNVGLSNTSIPVNIVVNAPNLNGFCGTAVSGDYEYKAETNNGIVTFRLHPLTPIAGSLYAVINLTANGAQNNSGMQPSGGDFVYSTPLANGTITSFYFTYNTPPGGERNSSANPHSYVVGTNCLGISGSTPVVSLTSPINEASFTEPATVTINATATDADGTVTKVEFFNGATLLGMDDTSPYSLEWTNVPAGNYTLSTRATDNDGYNSISNLSNIVVNINNASGFCGTLENGDYSYKLETINGNVVVTFHPLAPIAGCNSALIYVREGVNGGYPGYGMTKIGTDFRFSKPIADGTPISIYFTYQTPPSGERNSSATPHSYTVGDVCIGGAPMVTLTSPTALASYLTPANITIAANATDANGTIAKVEFFNGTTLLGTDDTAPYSFEWTNVPVGQYMLRAKATDNSGLLTTSAPVTISVNAPNANGYCGTAVNGDYEYKAETENGIVTFTFHPLAPILGSNLAILNLIEGGGGLAGYTMVAAGDVFTFSKPIANGVNLQFYFTYNTPPAGERNSSANPHTYVVGSNCIGGGTTPVTLINFNAVKQPNGSVAISWTTANEQNNDRFIVERGIDGRSFAAIAAVKAAGNSSSAKEYSIVDQLPARGSNYYRLTQVDIDGKKTTFGVRIVHIGDKKTNLIMYPNPLKGNQLYVTTGDATTDKKHVQIINATGAIILNGWFTPQANLLNIVLPIKPAPGLYLLKVEGYPSLKLMVN